MRLALGDAEFDVTHRALVMGILNRTPDSFYDAGRYYDFDEFLAKAAAHVADGADVLDVGGVKAGPGRAGRRGRGAGAGRAGGRGAGGAVRPPDLRRHVAIVRARRRPRRRCGRRQRHQRLRRPGLPAGRREARRPRWSPPTSGWRPGCPIRPRSTRRASSRRSCAFCAERAGWAEAAGIPHERIMVDAGLDLGKTEPMSLELLRASDRLAALGYPVLLSASNKRFLGEVLGLDGRPSDGWPRSAAHAQGIALGCRVLRAHDVRGSRRVADVMAAILEAQGLRGPERDVASCTSSTARTRRWSARRRPSSSAGSSGSADRSLMVADLTLDGAEVTVGHVVAEAQTPPFLTDNAGGRRAGRRASSTPTAWPALQAYLAEPAGDDRPGADPRRQADQEAARRGEGCGRCGRRRRTWAATAGTGPSFVDEQVAASGLRLRPRRRRPWSTSWARTSTACPGSSTRWWRRSVPRAGSTSTTSRRTWARAAASRRGT